MNLIGEHTDYTGGFVLPMAIQLGTTVVLRRGGDRLLLESAGFDGRADLPLDLVDPAEVQPEWARYPAGVVAALRPAVGGIRRVSTTLPVGAGLSSSAALELAVALALGYSGDQLGLAELGQRAEHLASGVPCGIMDQMVGAAGRAGFALLIDCSANALRPVAVPPDAAIMVVDSGQRRRLGESRYAERREECGRAEAVIGPLNRARPEDLAAIEDPVIRARARHVITENARVGATADALEAGDLAGAGQLMLESHASLRDDFEVSTPRLDALVSDLAGRAGVHGARLTGAGFGGHVVVLADPGALDRGHRVVPSAGASLI